jgi:hypothetical protein
MPIAQIGPHRSTRLHSDSKAQGNLAVCVSLVGRMILNCNYCECWYSEQESKRLTDRSPLRVSRGGTSGWRRKSRTGPRPRRILAFTLDRWTGGWGVETGSPVVRLTGRDSAVFYTPTAQNLGRGLSPVPLQQQVSGQSAFTFAARDPGVDWTVT